MSDKPAVLFVCIHNPGRSQMAAGYLTSLARGRIEVRSAGSLPGTQVNPVAIEAMAEEGIDISTQAPKILTTESVQASDVVITRDAVMRARYILGSVTRIGSWRIRPARASTWFVASGRHPRPSRSARGRTAACRGVTTGAADPAACEVRRCRRCCR